MSWEHIRRKIMVETGEGLSAAQKRIWLSVKDQKAPQRMKATSRKAIEALERLGLVTVEVEAVPNAGRTPRLVYVVTKRAPTDGGAAAKEKPDGQHIEWPFRREPMP